MNNQYLHIGSILKPKGNGDQYIIVTNIFNFDNVALVEFRSLKGNNKATLEYDTIKDYFDITDYTPDVAHLLYNNTVRGSK